MSAVEKASIRERIFAAAREIFVEKGYHNASIPEIVQRAGVSVGAVYHYFSGKDHLAKALHQHAVEEFLTRFQNEVRTQKGTRDKIRSFVALMFRWTEEDPVMVEYLLYARPKEVLAKKLSICSEEGLAAVREIIAEGMARGEIRPMDLYAATACLSGTTARMIELRLDGIVSYPLTAVIEQVAENIWLALKA